jgi:hypothetical protein
MGDRVWWNGFLSNQGRGGFEGLLFLVAMSLLMGLETEIAVSSAWIMELGSGLADWRWCWRWSLTWLVWLVWLV